LFNLRRLHVLKMDISVYDGYTVSFIVAFPYTYIHKYIYPKLVLLLHYFPFQGMLLITNHSLLYFLQYSYLSFSRSYTYLRMTRIFFFLYLFWGVQYWACTQSLILAMLVCCHLSHSTSTARIFFFYFDASLCRSFRRRAPGAFSQ
jgi:hypothetical protein